MGKNQLNCYKTDTMAYITTELFRMPIKCYELRTTTSKGPTGISSCDGEDPSQCTLGFEIMDVNGVK